jgi:hypothetical protein
VTLSKDTLAGELETMTPTDSEAVGIARFVSAFSEYFEESTVGGAECVSVALAGARSAMASAMTGVAGADSALAIQAGVTAWWGAVSSSAVSIWITVPPLASVTPPPTVASVQTAVLAAGQSNIAGKKSLEDSAESIAVALHTNNQGALAVNTAVPPVSIPIL